MKTKTRRRRYALLAGLATMLAAPLVNAQVSLPFEPFRADDIANTEYQRISIVGTIFNTADGVRIHISNQSIPGDGWVTSSQPTVARIYFDGNPTYLPNSPTFNAGDSSANVTFNVNGEPPNLPGGEEIGFSADYAFAAAPPPPQKGLDPGETASFDLLGSDYDTVLAGLVSGDFRIGVHIIEVGPKGEDSVPFVIIPEPSAALLGGLGLLALLRRKRR